MSDVDETAAARAAEAVRAAVGAPPSATTAWRWVTRLDDRPPYLLVGVSAGAEGWVGTVTPDGRVRGWAADPAGAHAWWTQVPDELVFAPGRGTRSALYPLRRTVDGGLLDHRGEPVDGEPRSRA